MRTELLRDVFVWAYERSSRRYKTVRESLPEPDPFRMKYRNALIEFVGEVVRHRLEPAGTEATEIVNQLVLPDDRARFRHLALAELAQLHEGNIARFRLRPTEFRRWQAR
jgi:hypothetical protein